MLEQEVVWINEALEGLPAPALSPMLNIGSSTLEFRTRTHPSSTPGCSPRSPPAASRWCTPT